MKKNIFSFYISKSDEPICDMPKKQKIGKYTMRTDSATPLDVCEDGERVCAVFGYAVDLTDGNAATARMILSAASSIAEVIEVEYKLGGKYLIIYCDEAGTYIIGDATCSIPIYYTDSGGEFICTSQRYLAVKRLGLSPDPDLNHIRNSGEISQAMPFDFTEYKELKQLIPNKALLLDERKAFRFVNSKQKQPEISASEAAKLTKPLIDALTKFYLDNFKIYCPITSGRDSRVVLAFLLSRTNAPVDSYTIRHKEHTGAEQDLTVPKRLASLCNMNYKQICDEELDSALKDAADEEFGAGAYSLRTLNIANTIAANFGDGAVINGDIIGQVGKCSLHRDIPIIFATPGYFRCKLHNYSKGARSALKSWLCDTRTGGERVNAFDLFSIENRMGRWAAQENGIYNSIGQLYLNIFNSRSIIYTWTAVKRAKRKKSLLHVELIKHTCPELLDIPFQKDESFAVRLSKANGLFYYLASYSKFFAERRKFMKEKK